jgi:hypothetical protein
MWWRCWWPLGLAKEVSYAAFSSPPPSTLKLQHRLRPTAETPLKSWVEGVAFIAANTLATGLSREEVSSLCILGWNFRGRATAMATALLGPWLDSSVLPLEVFLIIISSSKVESASGQHSGHHVIQNIRRRIILAIKYSPQGSWAVRSPRRQP